MSLDITGTKKRIVVHKHIDIVYIVDIRKKQAEYFDLYKGSKEGYWVHIRAVINTIYNWKLFTMCSNIFI